ncbi:MAG: AI-2E family transporter, partial [Candidatus Paceibacteria bacterium]
AALIFALVVLQRVVIMICAAFIIGSAISFGANWLETYRIPRSLAVVGLFILLVVLLGVAALVVTPVLLSQLSALLERFPQTIQSFINALPPQLESWGETLQQELSIRSLFSQLSDSLVSTTLSIVGGVLSFALTLVLSFYIALEPHAFDTMFVQFTPLEKRSWVRMYLSQARKRVGQWVIGHLAVALLLGLAVFLVLELFNVQYPLALAFLAGVLQLIPFLGPVFAAIPAFLFAWLQSPYLAVLVLLGYILLYQVETLFLTPLLLRQTAGLNPVIIILALLIGAKLAGVVGFLSVFRSELTRGIQSELETEKT